MNIICKSNLFLVILIICGPHLSHAQYPELDEDRQATVVTFANVGAGTTSLELGISSRVRDHLSTGIFLNTLWNNQGSLHTIDSRVIIGLKAKFYENESSNSFFAGPITAVNGIDSVVRPMLGLTSGFDHYGQINDRTALRTGIEFQAGLDTAAEYFIGIRVSIGIGYENDGLRGKPY